MKTWKVVVSVLVLSLAGGVAGAAPKSPRKVVEALRGAIAKHDALAIQALLPAMGTIRVTSGAGSADEEPDPEDVDRATLAKKLADPTTTVGAKVSCKEACCTIAHKRYKEPEAALMTVPIHEVCVDAGAVRSVRFAPVGI